MNLNLACGESVSLSYTNEGVVVNVNGEVQTYATIEDAVEDMLGVAIPLTTSEVMTSFKSAQANGQNGDGNEGSGQGGGESTARQFKRIYTVEEATRLSKDTGNTIKLRYK